MVEGPYLTRKPANATLCSIMTSLHTRVTASIMRPSAQRCAKDVFCRPLLRVSHTTTLTACSAASVATFQHSSARGWTAEVCGCHVSKTRDGNSVATPWHNLLNINRARDLSRFQALEAEDIILNMPTWKLYPAHGFQARSALFTA